MTATSKGASNVTLTSALAYLQAGLSVIPIRRDGTKAPAVDSWKKYEAQLPTEAEVRRWFDRAEPPGIAAIGGAISGGLECIDFDVQAESTYPQWCALVEAERPGLLTRLCVVRTPRPGFHVRFRCTELLIPGNTKLAVDPSLPKDRRCLIETRGEGGYALAPGSPVECHEFLRPYEHFAGPDITTLQTITAAERETLIRCACSFDLDVQADSGPAATARANGTDLRPGDDFNQRGPDWADILTGWAVAQTFPGGKRYWRRPGKEIGWSATTGVCTSRAGVELFACFSENADPFQGASGGKSCTCYSRFAAYTLLNHGGDFKTAAKELGRQGFGGQGGTFYSGAKASTNGHTGSSSKADPPPKSGYPLGNLTLVPGPARRTAGGSVRVQVGALKGGAVVYDFVLTASPAGWRQHAGMLEQLGDGLPDRAVILKTLAAIIAEAGRRADAPAPPTGPTVESIVKALAAPRWQLTARTPKGSAWSESRGCEVGRSEFIGCVDGELMDACAVATDAPKDLAGRVSRTDLLRLIQVELQVEWATLMRSLPSLSDADMGRNTAAGRAFREAMVRLWTAATTWEVPKKTDGEDSERIGATRASLISRVRSQHEQWERLNRVPQPREKWRKVHPAPACWWRVDSIDGEVLVHLGMRWEIVATMKQELPGVTEQDSLLRLGKQFGVLSVTHPVPDRLSGGKARLAVLAMDFAEELMSVPDEGDISDNAEAGYDNEKDSVTR